MRLRYEEFGAIVSLEDPPALVWVDHEMVRDLGYPDSPLWHESRGHLSGPTEVHLMTTNRCSSNCPGCYTSAEPGGVERPSAEISAALGKLAELEVFHVAMGGGESLLRDDIFELAEHARKLGMVPNLTTSGRPMNREIAERCRVFGQVNVSLDGLDESYRASRGYDGATKALDALGHLRDAEVQCGINYVVNAETFDAVGDTLRRAADLGIDEVEFLRFKPAGRGTGVYPRYRLARNQAQQLLPMLLEYAEVVPAIRLKIDCSLVPFLCAQSPEPVLLDQLGVFGCEAGNVLVAVKADLVATPCSFVDVPLGDVEGLVSEWRDHPELSRWRSYWKGLPEPCASCDYLSFCKGGCQAVSYYYTGSYGHPDPECPRLSSD